MNPIDLVLAAMVAVVSGTLGALTYSRVGWFINVVIGFFGALAGVALARHLPIPVIYDIVIQGTVFPVVYSLVGSVLFVAAIGILIKPKNPDPRPGNGSRTEPRSHAKCKYKTAS